MPHKDIGEGIDGIVAKYVESNWACNSPNFCGFHTKHILNIFKTIYWRVVFNHARWSVVELRRLQHRRRRALSGRGRAESLLCEFRLLIFIFAPYFANIWLTLRAMCSL